MRAGTSRKAKKIVTRFEQETVNGVTVAGFYIRLRIDGKPGEISVDSMFHTPRGWVLGDGFKD